VVDVVDDAVVVGAVVVVELSVVVDVDVDVVVESESDVTVAATGSDGAKPIVPSVDVLTSFVATLADSLSFPTNTIVRMISATSATQTVTNAMRRRTTRRRSSGQDDSSSSHWPGGRSSPPIATPTQGTTRPNPLSVNARRGTPRWRLALWRRGTEDEVRQERRREPCVPGHGRWPARFVELEGEDHLPYGDQESIIGEIEEFLTGERHQAPIGRVLATVVFTDIVDSTTLAAHLGDSEWRRVLDGHDHATHRVAALHRGRVIKSTGDGALATFDGPARAARYATELARDVAPLELVHALKGVPDKWQVYVVAG
jgi:hypothetical protein